MNLIDELYKLVCEIQKLKEKVDPDNGITRWVITPADRNELVRIFYSYKGLVANNTHELLEHSEHLVKNISYLKSNVDYVAHAPNPGSIPENFRYALLELESDLSDIHNAQSGMKH